MIIIIPCSACKQRGLDSGWRSSKQQTAAVVCRACDGTGQMRVEETLPCAECRLKGKPDGELIYQDTIGQLAVWRCAVGHVWTEVVGTGTHR